MALRADCHKWTDEEEERVLALYDDGMGYDDIAVEVKIPRGAVKSRVEKLRYENPKPRNNQNHHGYVDPALLDDRAARAEARGRRDLTAEFFGDPAPGFSALDKRRGAQ